MLLVMVQKSGQPFEVGSFSLSQYLQGFIHLRWCRISFINSISPPNPSFQNKKTHYAAIHPDSPDFRYTFLRFIAP